MRALVVYESMFGNTEKVARAVAEGLAEQMTVDTHEVTEAPAVVDDLVDLIVVGGPTHALSLSRPGSRADAHSKGATMGSVDEGVREWLQHLPKAPHSESVAVFDTRAEQVRHLPGSAAKKAVRIAHHQGYSKTIARESFYVSDISGPLVPGEVDRAREWGRGLARQVTEAAGAGR